MSTAVVLFSRDLRVHDNPALAAAAAQFDEIVPLFVLEERLLGSANRSAFLLETLGDLRDSLGGRLVVRRGDVVAETLAIRPDAVFVAADSSVYARNRERRLAEQVELTVLPGPAIVPPGELHPAGSDHYRVFSPYWRAWVDTPLRALAGDPPTIRLPAGIDLGRLPTLAELGHRVASPGLPRGGESEGRCRLAQFLETGLATYGDTRDAFSPGSTSRLSPYLHFGCVSAVELARLVRGRVGAEPFLRQLCWRDFYLQLLAARPDISQADYRPRGDEWREDGEALRRLAGRAHRIPDRRRCDAPAPAARAGCPGVRACSPRRSSSRTSASTGGWAPRTSPTCWSMVTWRATPAIGSGSRGRGRTRGRTGSSTRCARRCASTRTAPTSACIVPELASLPPKTIHEPWKLGVTALARLGYPAPLVDHAEASAAFASSRARVAALA